jgi:glycosyltransferase involved in cell wall biosynthesis
MFVGNAHRGQESFEKELRRRIEETPILRDRVHVFPYTRQILPYYEALDVNLLISREEAFGRTIIESAALGAPSIGSRVGGIPEIIADGSTGILVESEAVDPLADAIFRLGFDPELRTRMGEAAFRHTAQNFSIASHAQKMMTLYDEAVAKALSPGF